MSTRRVFLKCLGGLSAGLLPWYGWSEVLKNINSRLAPAPLQRISSIKTVIANSAPQIDAAYLKRSAMEDILALTQPDLQGRRAGSVGEDKAATYLINQMRGLRLNPLGDLMTDSQRNYSHAFTIYPVVEEFFHGRLTFRPGDPNSLRTPSANIIGGLIGTNSHESVILSAHYDHLGIFQGNLYPGANDNASGVGCILDVMRRLIRDGVKPKRNVVLAFWSAEEMGFVGSYSFLQKPTFPQNSIQAVFNVDTVGNGLLREFSLWANGENAAVQAVMSAVDDNNAKASLTPSNGYNSDQVYFNLDRVPAVTLMARDWLYKNHTPEDIPSFVESQKIALASDILYGAIHELAF